MINFRCEIDSAFSTKMVLKYSQMGVVGNYTYPDTNNLQFNIIDAQLTLQNYINTITPLTSRVYHDSIKYFGVLGIINSEVYRSTECFVVKWFKECLPFYKRLYLKYWMRHIIFYKEPYRSL
jgi:hypothetical protein